MRTLLPEGWPTPKGYANGIEARGRTIFVAGQIGWTPEMKFEALDFIGQLEQALKNVLAVLKAGGAGPEHVTRMTWYITDKRAYADNLRDVGRVWRATMGRNFPAMTAVQVTALIEDAALIEIETTAVVPD